MNDTTSIRYLDPVERSAAVTTIGAIEMSPSRVFVVQQHFMIDSLLLTRLHNRLSRNLT